MSTDAALRLAFIGFGEAAGAIARGLIETGVCVEMRGYDIKSDSGDDAQIRRNYEAAGVIGCATLGRLLQTLN